MNRYNFFLIVAILAILFMWMAQCQADGNWTGREYMPDMAHSQAYETYVAEPGSRAFSNVNTNISDAPNVIFSDGKVARQPVAGTVARGNQPYGYSNNDSGYEQSSALVNPYGNANKEVLADGKELYTIYCAVCHGEKGLGGGSISTTSGGPFGGVPNYFGAAYIQMPEGKMFHSIHYGKADMGSYASQMTKDERWKVVSYIKDMQAKNVEGDHGSYENALRFVRNQSKPEPVMIDGFAVGESDLDKLDGKLTSGSIINLKNVFFSSGSANLSPASYMELDKLEALLRANPETKVELSGHTDSDGSPAANMNLSDRRAKAAMNYLILKGISAAQLGAKGYGDSSPIAPNDTPEGKAQNRRTELKVL